MIGYKSLLTVVGGDPAAGSALDGATALAEHLDAHLDVLALGVDLSSPGYYYAGASALLEQQSIERARAEAQAGGKAAEAFLSGRSLRWAVGTGVAQLGTIQFLVGGQARFADLVVLPKPYGKDRGMEEEAVLEAALFAGRSSVLVLPQGTVDAAFRRIVIAWNESAEAMSAVRAALPFLVRASYVNIVIVDPPRHGPDRSDPGGALSQMLARHGARAEISVVAGTMPRTADVLLRHAADKTADLLVMGAYGHSRFRESVLGGATRDMLESATLPVLMHH